MQLKLANKHRSKARRRGLSILEFVGCLVALCGGTAGGLMYLGIDLQAAADEVLQSPQVAELQEFTLFSASEDQPTAESKETLGEKNDRTANPTSASSEAEENLETIAESTTLIETKSKPAEELTEAQREKATQGYWKTLTTCVQKEAFGRQSGFKNFENWHLLDYLTHRLEGHQQVIDKIEQLDNHGVEQRVTSHAEQVLSWHRAGVKLNQRALDLITDGPKADLQGPVAQSWQSAATQHRMEEKLIQERHLGIASYLAHAYKTPRPAEPVASP